MIINIQNELLHLLPQRALYWPKEKLLVISDLHAGKSAHFRKNGIPVPALVLERDLQVISKIIAETVPEKLLFLGDFFHSSENKELENLNVWMSSLSVEFHLVMGNHDRHSIKRLSELPMKIYEENLLLGPFLFSHDRVNSPNYNIYGHLHPAVELKGKARQYLRLPCFLFANDFGILPAFGSFTGNHLIKPKEGEMAYVVTGDGVFKI